MQAIGSMEDMKQQEKCPRCESINTKFCYYNNYNLTQPRHFCKTCRRFWTKGGSLRNIPVGGSSRKNSKQPSSTSSKRPSNMQPPSDHHQHSQSGIFMKEIQFQQS